MKVATLVTVPLLVLAGAVSLIAQPPAGLQVTPPRTVNVFDDQIVAEQRADGTMVHRTQDGRIVQTFSGKAAGPRYGAAGALVPSLSADGRPVYVLDPNADPEAAKLYSEEVQVTQEAGQLVDQLRRAESDADREKLKTQLKEKLAAIFDLQQQRRAREIAKIEERLAKLKGTMKKRQDAKDDIVDRKLDQLTGGVDELGWEDTIPLGPNANVPARVGQPYPDGPAFVPLQRDSALPAVPGTRGVLPPAPPSAAPAPAPPALRIELPRATSPAPAPNATPATTR